MLHFPRFARFHDQPGPGARAFPGQMMVDGAGSQQAGDGGISGVHAAVGQDDDVFAGGDGLRCGGAEGVQGRLQGAGLGVKQSGQRCRGQAGQVQRADLRQLRVGEQRAFEAQLPAVGRRFVKQVLLAADESLQGSYQLLADGIQGRVGYLGEQLLEVVKQGAVLVGQRRQRRIVAH